jgi:hypothetical protein
LFQLFMYDFYYIYKLCFQVFPMHCMRKFLS